MLAILSGGIGRYLRAKGDDTSNLELRAMCPVSMRRSDQHGELGNLVSVMIAPLFVGIEDPIERHRAGIDAMVRNKEAKQAEALFEMNRWSELVPPASQRLAGQLPIPPTLFNTVSTNVPGPQIPLYQGGRKCLAWYPLGIVSSGIGLFTAILTYDQRITLGTTVDAEQIPDPWLLSECIRDAYHELREISGVQPIDFPAFPFVTETGSETPRSKKKATSKKARSKKATKKKATKKKAKRQARTKAARSAAPRR